MKDMPEALQDRILVEASRLVTEAVDTAARTSHEVNRAWCQYNGDDSQPAWDDAPEWQRDSAINGAIFHLDNPDAGDDASHQSWMAEKLIAGWVYGEVKNPDAEPPTHPCIVPFEDLPREQQFKDRLFRTIVHAVAKAHGIA